MDLFRTRSIRRNLIALLMIYLTLSGTMSGPGFAAPASAVTATPIKHLVVIFQENVSFDHYFATYPVAANPSGEPKFVASPDTPTVNGVRGGLLTDNPNLNPANGAGASNPFRLDRSQAVAADQDHNYLDEQEAFDAGLMDLFPSKIGTAGPPPTAAASDRHDKGPYHGLFRRQHSNGALELRAALCYER